MDQTTRPVILARDGMVSSPHYLASAAGLRVLQDGGTAVDAAITVNATLGVVYPHMTGVGGDALWLVYDAASRHVHSLNGSGRAGSAATREFFRSRGQKEVPSRGPLAAITVPGAVDSWCRAHERFGALPLARVLAPAIDYARDGYPVCRGQAVCLHEVADVLARYGSTREQLLPSGRPPRVGEVIRLPKLAETLASVADKGRAGFYEGPVADEIAASTRVAGGLLTADDLAGHHSDWVQPVSTTYRGLTCYQHPPNSQGFAHLLILNILEGFDVAGLGEDSAAYVHALVEATKLAFVDRDRYLTDPEFCAIPLDELLSKGYAGELRARIDSARAHPPIHRATAPAGDTTATVVVDAAGNAVSVIQSLYHECGSGFVAGDTGVLLQNRGAFFSLDDDHVNRLEPGKRTSHTLMPGMLFRDDQPYLVYGTMGGEGQPQTATALVTRIVDFDYEPQRAIDQPRWLFGRTWGEDIRDLRIEGRFPETVISGLRGRDHPVRVVDDWDNIMGQAQAIRLATESDIGAPRDPRTDAGRTIDGDRDRPVLMGGADPRGDGLALGW